VKTAIVGGGAAGFFLAITLKEQCPQMDVTIFERSSRVLRKVKVSGGGRCNCTNTFADVRDLSAVYPRGHRLMKRLMKGFDQRDAYHWFERHGVPLTVQDDQCVFPAAQNSQVIINCFISHCRRLGVRLCLNTIINSLSTLQDYDFIALTTGGQPRQEGLTWLEELGHEIVAPVPSLFTFSINDQALLELMGTVVEHVTASIPATGFSASGPLLVTHWGMSGPAILRLSSYAARYLAKSDYQAPLAINWTGHNEEETRQELQALFATHPKKQLSSLRPFDLPTRLWLYLLEKEAAPPTLTPNALPKKSFNKLVNQLTADHYTIASRAPFKDEFVTCGGIALNSVNPVTLESKHRPRLFFAGELLDIDGITGGFNFQAVWTTAYTVAQAIAKSS